MGHVQWAASAAACSLSHLGEHSISMASILAARTRSGRESLVRVRVRVRVRIGLGIGLGIVLLEYQFHNEE